MASLVIRFVIAIGGIAILSWLFYRGFRKKKQVFFHPPCPRCGLTLQQCYDDELLALSALQGYSTSLNRYMYCSECFDSQTSANFYADKLENLDHQTIVKDCADLITEFAQLLEKEDKDAPLPCSDCLEFDECYGSNNLVFSRLVPFSFYPFYMLIKRWPGLKHSAPLTSSNPYSLDAFPEPYVWINTSTAAKLGIQDEDMVEVKSQVGAIKLKAKLTERIRPDCVMVPHNYGHTVPELTFMKGPSDGHLSPERPEKPLHGKDWSAVAWMSDVCVSVQKV